MAIIVARSVTKHVKHAMGELPQTVRLVQLDSIRIIITGARNVISHV